MRSGRSGQCYYPSMRTENKGLLALFSVRQGRWIDYNFKCELMGTGNLSSDGRFPYSKSKIKIFSQNRNLDFITSLCVDFY